MEKEIDAPEQDGDAYNDNDDDIFSNDGENQDEEYFDWESITSKAVQDQLHVPGADVKDRSTVFISFFCFYLLMLW